MRLKKLITTAVITAAALMMTTALQPNDAYAASGWQKNNTGWWWENADGSYPVNTWEQINGTWYYFDGSGYMTTGWQKVGDIWYYMDGSGAMQTGWVKVGNTWYYMYSSGAMAANTVIDGYTVNADGAWVTGGSSSSASGWIQDGTGWWYRHSDGSYTKNGWEQIGNSWYYFDKSGYMYTGWLQKGTIWYYLKDDGAMASGKTLVGDTVYIFGSTGQYLGDKYEPYKPADYYLDWDYIAKMVNSKLQEAYPNANIYSGGSHYHVTDEGGYWDEKDITGASWTTGSVFDGSPSLVESQTVSNEAFIDYAFSIIDERLKKYAEGVEPGTGIFEIGMYVDYIETYEDGVRDICYSLYH